MTRLQAVALVWVALTLAIVLLNIFLRQHFGPAALGAIFEPYLVLSGLVAGFVGFRAPLLAGRALIVVLVVVALLRYVPVWVSFAPNPGEARSTLRVSAWNIHAGDDAAQRALRGISTSNADLIALEELEAEAAAALTPEATGFEFSVVRSGGGFPDVGLLSRYPILESRTSRNPPFVRAVIDPPSAEPIVVYAIHAPLGRYVMLGGLPVGVDLSLRDPAILSIRSEIDADLAEDRSVVVVGDFNTTERELAYAQISAGLRDAHLDAGTGPGLTWRPGPLTFLPFGLLRIDYVFTTPDIVATNSTVDCSLPSDHCRVDVELRLGTGT